MGRATGSVYRSKGARGDVWRARLRLPDGRHLHRRVGPVWTGRGRPPAGHYSRRTAEAWVRDTLRSADDGTLPGLVRTGATISGLADEYLAHLERDRGTKPSTLRDYRSILTAHVRPAFGDMAPEELTGEHVERWQRSLQTPGGQPLSPRTRAKILTLLRGIMAYATDRHRLPGNPVERVRAPVAQRRTGIDVLSVEEVHALVRAAAGEQDAAIVLTAALSGLRAGELLALRWRAVDFARSSLRVVESYSGGALTSPKSHRARVVPLAPEVARALARLSQRPERTGPDDLVFPGEHGEFLDGSALRRRFKRALRAAGLRDLRFHDLRHTFGTRCAAAGIDLWRVQHWLGHADMATTQVYAHYAPQATDAALVAGAFAGEAADPAVSEPATGPGGP